MATVIIIISIVTWIISMICLLGRRPALGPTLSYLALWWLHYARIDGYKVLPINSTILYTWLAMTLIVIITVIMQPARISSQTRGTGYMLGGALAGLAVGLAAGSVTTAVSVLYGIMIVAVVLCIFFGYLLFTRTPAGRGLNVASGDFFRYLLAKGFPTAITVMMAGIPLVMLMAMR